MYWAPLYCYVVSRLFACLFDCLICTLSHHIYISLTVLFEPPKTLQRDTTPEGSYGDLQSKPEEGEEFKIINLSKKGSVLDPHQLQHMKKTSNLHLGLHQLIAVMSLKGCMRTDNLWHKELKLKTLPSSVNCVLKRRPYSKSSAYKRLL